MGPKAADHSWVRINVLMPVFQPNLAWLKLAISSLLQQSESQWQLVLSLDGDDPETGAAATLARQLISTPQQLIVVEGPRSGITGTLNRGLSHCHSPFIARMDADDICLPERLSRQSTALESDPKLIAIGMQIQGIDHNHQPIPKSLHHYPSSTSSTLLMGALFNTPIAHPVLMMRRNALQSIGGYREQRCMEDYDLLARLSTVGKLNNLKYLGLLYRIHPSQHSRQVRPFRLQLLKARLRFLKETGIRNPLHWLLIPIPLLLFAIGPRCEYISRRLFSSLASRFKKTRGS